MELDYDNKLKIVNILRRRADAIRAEAFNHISTDSHCYTELMGQVTGLYMAVNEVWDA